MAQKSDQKVIQTNKPPITINTKADSPVTPIKIQRLMHYLQRYLHKSYLLEGFKVGFRLGYIGPRRPSFAQNLKSAKEHPDILRDKINNEVSLGRLVGLFTTPPFHNLQISPVGLVLKKASGQFRMIQHLSHPFNQ